MRTIVEVLEHIRYNGPENKRFGICLNIDLLLSDIGEPLRPVIASQWREHRVDAYTKWPHWSICDLYPVPDPNGRADAPIYASHKAKEWYLCAQYDGVLWDRDTRYGALRWGLLDHLIAYFKELKP